LTSLYTYPPLVHGEISIIGTLKPNPIGFPAGIPNTSVFVNSPSDTTVDIPSELSLGGVGTQ